MTADRWREMLQSLAGEPLPALPPCPTARVHRKPDGDARDPMAEQWEALERRTGSGALAGSRRWSTRP